MRFIQESLSTATKDRRWIKLLSLNKKLNPVKKILFDRFQFLPASNLPYNSAKRVVLSIFRMHRGSCTVEASFVVPLFIFAYLAVLQLLWIVGAQITIHNSMYEAGLMVAKTGYMTQEKANVGNAVGIATFYSKANKEYLDCVSIVGGSAGIVVTASQEGDDTDAVMLNARYIVNNRFDILGLWFAEYQHNLLVRRWNGVDTLDRDRINKNSKSHMIYLTTYGEVYHESKECAYLELSIRVVTAEKLPNERNMSREKYDPCNLCGYKKDALQFYITDYGGVYHTKLTCSGLIRGIMSVAREDTDRRACPKCGG